MNTYKKGDYKRYYVVDALRVFGFFEDYRFLSNFHMCDVMYDGVFWPSSEHAYMVAKCKNIRKNISNENIYNDYGISRIQNMTCSEVRKWGQTVELRNDWEQIKEAIMLQINLDKYIRNHDVREKLLATGQKALIEANSWNDSYWGFDVDKQRGSNKLGNILMQVRTLLNDN